MNVLECKQQVKERFMCQEADAIGRSPSQGVLWSVLRPLQEMVEEQY
ncbi:MAG: hypothetical protein NZO16_05415 [Deltaproteobacteria bacterium]|nr:hypothetical protein [Deltaproteobacteria bacterium]